MKPGRKGLSSLANQSLHSQSTWGGPCDYLRCLKYTTWFQTGWAAFTSEQRGFDFFTSQQRSALFLGGKHSLLSTASNVRIAKQSPTDPGWGELGHYWYDAWAHRERKQSRVQPKSLINSMYFFLAMFFYFFLYCWRILAGINWFMNKWACLLPLVNIVENLHKDHFFQSNSTLCPRAYIKNTYGTR